MDGQERGTPSFVEEYVVVANKVTDWVQQIRRLAEFQAASTQPQAAYSAFIQGLQPRWSFLSRTLEDAPALFGRLEDVIRDILIPALTGHAPPSSQERALLAFPCRHGGLGITDPTSMGGNYRNSRKITTSLWEKLIAQDSSLDGTAAQVLRMKAEVRTTLRTNLLAAVKSFKDGAGAELELQLTLASEKGASSWLTCRPLAIHGFRLSKAEFRDALCLWYGWTPARLPSGCVCGHGNFDVTHALSCSTGGFPSIRHNEIRDLTADVLRQVTHGVCTEPMLQPVTGEKFRLLSTTTADQARLDVAANGIWGGRFERTFLDIRVFNPYAASNRAASVSSVYARHEKEKRRRYEQRLLEVDRATFVPVVLSATGGTSKCASALFKRLASMLSDKLKELYSVTMAWLRCKLSFALVRASVMCLRGARSSSTHRVTRDTV
ncbi:uncharacterized protein LOC135820204 [Sycon ciliatum]|uniref:uncharacterized protein LOC135820204 n=1 Tax=Sycon ciliatum TaxID=27933 RepID=UPI0031F61085